MLKIITKESGRIDLNYFSARLHNNSKKIMVNIQALNQQ